MDQQQVENQIKQIPGNEAVLEKLYKLLDAGEAIAFVGAGASAGLWPLWDEFLAGFVEYSLKLGKINNDEAHYLKNEAHQNPLETAQQLRNKTGERDYFEYLQETFQDKISPHTNAAFTLTHKALLQLPIHNYLTLNYDAGLTNARAALYPRATTSYFFWDQDDARNIRERGFKRLVLHAHGRHDRADSIILTLNDYRKAYDHRPFVRLLNEIFNAEKLLFIGFGMNDPYIKQLFNNISKESGASPFRHIAFVGLNEAERKVSHMHRERVEMIYGARVLFYPTENHHQALTDWLNMLTEKYRDTADSQSAQDVEPLPAPPQIKAAIKDKYEHRPTDDENYQGRTGDFAVLNRWANDPATRIIAITGIGGQGKTAMTGRWLKHEREENLKNIPVFYWSFYEDMEVEKFLKQVVAFCLPIDQISGQDIIESIPFIIRVVQKARLLLVLDGLEVLQEDAASVNHGEISDPFLAPFLRNWLRVQHKGLMVLTSRFHFPQLERFSGVGFHRLDLTRLSAQDGVSLLKKLNIYGDANLLERYVEKLSGHPLALRVLASAVKRSCYGNIDACKSEQILFEDGEGKLYDKLNHLLSFYEKQLKDGQRELLGIISLFKRPIETESFVTLLGNMESLKDTPLAKADAATIERQLKLLIDDFLIEKTDEGITTHPVIRDYFRAGHKIAGSRREAADFLQARPGAERPETIEQVRDLVEAVTLLCDEGEFKAADDLVTARLTKGGYGFNVFKHLPAIPEGLECNLAFVAHKDRRQKVAKILGEDSVAFYYSGVSFYNYLLGNLAQAIEWRYKVLEISRQLQDKHNQAGVLDEIASIEMVMGKISKARETVSQALSLSHETRDLGDLSTEFAYKACYEFLLGHSVQAYQDFKVALFYEQKRKSDEKTLSSLSGNYQAEFFLRIQAWKQFAAVNAWNIKSCEQYQWNDNLAMCRMLQGWYEICQGRFSQAEQALMQAEKILRPSGMLEDTCRLDWVWALLAEAQGDFQKGLHHVNNALSICAEKGFRLRLADHFILRGRLYLLQFQKENQQEFDLVEKAGDDGENALEIAEETGYIWAKTEALELLSAYHQTKAAFSQFKTEQEKESAARYAKQAADIKKDLFLTEEQMKELNIKAKEEFEKQTAGWD